jgi:glyoxylase-like metal-dependent hydrolase (beta-lactamase superfamily II)
MSASRAIAREAIGVRIERVVTSGTFNLDGGCWEVDNNVWLLGDGDEVLVVDAAHDADAVSAAVDGRRVVAIVCTHGHDDHVGVAPELADRFDATVWLHPEDKVLWQLRHPDASPGGDLADGQEFVVGGLALQVLHTPGHSPGSVCLVVPALGAVFTGDTLFPGGPGATGRSYSDAGLIQQSIRRQLMTLDPSTTVYPGHGNTTTIGAEAHLFAD